MVKNSTGKKIATECTVLYFLLQILVGAARMRTVTGSKGGSPTFKRLAGKTRSKVVPGEPLGAFHRAHQEWGGMTSSKKTFYLCWPREGPGRSQTIGASSNSRLKEIH